MKKIYVKGYYGYRNLGDDIFTVTAEWVFREIFKKSTPIFIGENLPNLSSKSKKIIIQNRFIRRILEFITFLTVDLILYYGGSLFTSGGRSIFDLRFYIRKFPFLSKKLITLGTSIGPFKDEYDYNTTRDLLNNFEMIGVRDYSSLKILKDMNLGDRASFVFDNAILVDNVFPSIRAKEKNSRDNIKIGISLCRYETFQKNNIENERIREESLKKTLDEILSKYSNISEFVFFEFNGNPSIGDLEVTKEFYEYFKKKINVRIVNYTKETVKILDELYDCDFIMGVRLHSGILAYALEIPFMLVEYHTKCTEFLNTINHKFRFDSDDIAQNIMNFDDIISIGRIPDVIKPDYFKKIMLKELDKVKNMI